MIKSEMLMRLEAADVVWQDSDGKWYNGFKSDVDLTPYLLRAGCFEH